MITERLKQDTRLQDGSSSMDSLRDLQQVMASVSQNARDGARTKGSRFAHTEKLVYGKVRTCFKGLACALGGVAEQLKHWTWN